MPACCIEPRRGWAGKIEQSLRALQLEARYSKREILSMYLTLAPFGGNIEGVHMASRIFFGKEPATLNLAEAVLLIALPQSPTARRPISNPAAAADGRSQVLRRLAEAGRISAADMRLAEAEALPVQRQALPFTAPHLAAAAARRTSAPVVQTSIDGGLQQKLEQLARQEASWFPDAATVAILVAELPSRRILASVSGHDFATAQGQVDLTTAIRSPGSTLKPFIYAMALDAGEIHPETVIDDRPTRFGTYLPRNFDRQYQGRITMRDALQQSLNVPAVAVLERLGPARFAAQLQSLGFAWCCQRRARNPALPLRSAVSACRCVISSAFMPCWLMTDATPRFRPSKETLPYRIRPWWRPTSARQIGDILADAPRPAGIQGTANNMADRIAYKTGTSYGFRDAWSVGYTGSHVVGVWVGRPDGTPRPGAYGRNTAAPLMFHIFDILGGRGGEAPRFAVPDQAEMAVAPPRLPPPALRNFPAPY